MTGPDAAELRRQQLEAVAKGARENPISQRVLADAAVRISARPGRGSMRQANIAAASKVMREAGVALPPDVLFDAASDDDLARAFTLKHGRFARYVSSWDRWYLWDGKRWARDERRAPFDLARSISRAALDEVLANPELTPAQHRAARQRFGAASTVWNVVKLAGTDPAHAITPDMLDADPWLLNTPGGIVDLRTGVMGPHDPAKLCTKITTAAPGGDCPTFHAVLARIQPDAAVRDYVQRLAGYALTGSAREHVLPFFHGAGRNGKGTVAHAIRRAMGDYGLEVPAELLTESHNERHPCELAVLHGARFVVGSEIDSGKRWNESRLKRLTGGDPISARFIGRDPFEFQPTHTLVILANSKPGIRNVDEAMRARLHLVPFDVTIPEAERDPTLPEKLEAEAGGILAWAIAGCLDWLQDGLNPPDAVRAASAAYLEGEDSIAGWIAEKCQRRGQIKLTAAHRAYREWCDAAGIPPLGRTAFGDALASHGIARSVDRKESVIFSGLSLADSGYDPRFPND